MRSVALAGLLLALVAIALPHFVNAASSEVNLVPATPGSSTLKPDSDHKQEGQSLAVPWLDVAQSNDIVYFLYQSPPRIERFDVNQEIWLADILLNDTPTAFAVDPDGLYISFARRTSRFSVDGTGEVHLRNTSQNVTGLSVVNQVLYIFACYSSDPYTLLAVNKTSGALVDSKSCGYYNISGLAGAPRLRKVFAGTPAMLQVVLNDDGTIGSLSGSTYGGGAPPGSRAFVFPGEARVATNSGAVYNTNDLSYSNSLAGAFDDLAFYGDLPIVLRGGTLVAYSNAFAETGRYTPGNSPLKIVVNGEFILSFYGGSPHPQIEKVPVSALHPGTPWQPVDPNGLPYVPDAVALGRNQIVYLLSRANLSIFRWSASLHTYLETIPLAEAPTYMAYSGETNRLYLSYPSRAITQIKLDESKTAQPFVTSPEDILGLSTAGKYLFVCDRTSPWVSHWTYSPEGALISHKDWNYSSKEYVWSETNRKMYFFRDHSPSDLLWETIDVNGALGAYQDSPYHEELGWWHPIRVSPDGSAVLIGSGRIFDATSLRQVDSLSNNISDATWLGSSLFTLRPYASGSQVQRWGVNYGVDSTKQLDGVPMRLFAVDNGLLAITVRLGIPWFELMDVVRASFSAAPVNGAVPLTVTFTNQSTGGFTSSLWSFGDGTTSTQQSPSHTYTTAGGFTVTLTVSSPTDRDTRVLPSYIVVHAPVHAEFTAAPLMGTVPLTVTFTNQSTGAFASSLWSFGDGITSTLASPTHVYTAVGTYTVTLDVSGPGGSDTLAKPSYISASAPVPPLAIRNVQASPNPFNPAQGSTTVSFNLSAACTNTAGAAASLSSGSPVRTWTLGAQGAGARSVQWDGKNSTGMTLGEGFYAFYVACLDQGNQAVGYQIVNINPVITNMTVAPLPYVPQAGSASLHYTLSVNTSTPTLALILNLQFQAVKTFPLSMNSAGTISLTWDGRDGSGNLVPNGRYIYAVVTVNPNNSNDRHTALYFFDVGTPQPYASGEAQAQSQIAEAQRRGGDALEAIRRSMFGKWGKAVP